MKSWVWVCDVLTFVGEVETALKQFQGYVSFLILFDICYLLPYFFASGVLKQEFDIQ